MVRIRRGGLSPDADGNEDWLRRGRNGKMAKRLDFDDAFVKPYDGCYQLECTGEERLCRVTGDLAAMANKAVDYIRRGTKDLSISQYENGRWHLVYLQGNGFTPAATPDQVDFLYCVVVASVAARDGKEWSSVQIYLREWLPASKLYRAEFIWPAIESKQEIYLTRETLERHQTMPTCKIMDCTPKPCPFCKSDPCVCYSSMDLTGFLEEPKR